MLTDSSKILSIISEKKTLSQSDALKKICLDLKVFLLEKEKTFFLLLQNFQKTMAATVEEKAIPVVVKQGWIKKKGMQNFTYFFITQEIDI